MRGVWDPWRQAVTEVTSPGWSLPSPWGLSLPRVGHPVHTNFLPHSPLARARSPLARPLARLTAHPKFTVEGRWKHELNAVQRLCPETGPGFSTELCQLLSLSLSLLLELPLHISVSCYPSLSMASVCVWTFHQGKNFVGQQ